ncbi:hypothetical protein P8935_02030 [Telmatobacter sp. DSM 110680]|uniref:PepSY domain-containing protein n=1 Tax=Telmatobacter sp. DSM 110680 TaxID=3036704 RepID=A0AAU7DM43_9BACT
MNTATNSNVEAKLQGPSKSAARLKWARQWHLYLGTLFAPSILFFAFTGSLQLFGLHESHPGDSYQAPAWVQRLASIHKDQVIRKQHGPPPDPAKQQSRPPQSDEAQRTSQPVHSQPGGGRQNEESGPSKLTLALKWFFLAVAAGLIFSTLLGIYMAFKFNRSRALVWGMLFLGTAIPLALVLMMV